MPLKSYFDCSVNRVRPRKTPSVIRLNQELNEQLVTVKRPQAVLTELGELLVARRMI